MSVALGASAYPQFPMAQMRQPEGYSLAVTTVALAPTFTLVGGMYSAAYVAGNWNSFTVSLQVLGPDGSTYVTAATAFSANGFVSPLYLPPGSYRLLPSGTVTTGNIAINRVSIAS
jgi:hypothetical protein